MSDQDEASVFSADAPAPKDDQTAGAPPTESPIDAVLLSIKRSDGTQKYSSVEEALKAIPNADKHISELEEELKGLRNKNLEADAADRILEKLSAKTGDQGLPAPAQLDEAKIAELVTRQLSATEKANQVKTNLAKVDSALLGAYGTVAKGKEALVAKVEEIGISLEFFQEVVGKSPKAALDLLGVKGSQAQLPSRMSSSVNIDGKPTPPTETGFKMVGSTSQEMISEWNAAGEEASS